MNKYQEALDNLIRVSCPRKVSCKECDFEKLCNSQAKGYVDTIQKLVDRATPKKPKMMRVKKYDGYNLGICKCGKDVDTSLDEVNFCPRCGQALDWSDEE